jgi:hypothetical protein
MASGEGQVVFDATLQKVEDAHSEDPTLVLSEEQALARARHSPDKTLSICIAFAHDDRDNPRNWGKLRKWYITFFVSMLNVLTCVSSSILHNLADEKPAAGALGASRQEPPASPKSSMSPLKSPHSVSRCTC